MEAKTLEQWLEPETPDASPERVREVLAAFGRVPLDSLGSLPGAGPAVYWIWRELEPEAGVPEDRTVTVADALRAWLDAYAAEGATPRLTDAAVQFLRAAAG